MLFVLGESVARLISAAILRRWSTQLAVVLGAALITLAALWWTWLAAADRAALTGPGSIAGFTAANLPIVAETEPVRSGCPARDRVGRLGLVFMGAIVVPVYLVPALAVVLAAGIAAESHPNWPTALRVSLARQRS